MQKKVMAQSDKDQASLLKPACHSFTTCKLDD